MPEAFEVETRGGVRKVEFDPDLFRFRDVRILVDGARVAQMPYPKPATPYHEIAFELDGHRLVGVGHMTAVPNSAEPLGVHYDLFADDRSLTDGTPLADARTAAPGPGEAYPGSFRVIDLALRITPAASAPGIAIGVTRAEADLGWPSVIGLLGLMLAGIGLATIVASRAWARIRESKTRSVLQRTALGWMAVVGCFGIAFAGVIVLAVVIGQAGR